MTAAMEPRYRYMTRVNWTDIANIAGSKRWRINDVVNGRKKNKRLSSLLATMELPRKIDWRRVTDDFNPYLPRPYNPRYTREVAMGYRRNARLYRLLEMLGVIEMVKKQRSFNAAANKQQEAL